MRILVDAYWWHRGPRSLQRVVRQLVSAWVERFPDDELIVQVRAPRSSDRFPFPAGVRVLETRIRPQMLAASLLLAWRAGRIEVDHLLTQNFTSLRRPSAVFVHDFMFCDHPEYFSRRERLYFRLMPLTARRASMVFTSSVTEAKRISRTMGSSSPPVVPLGLGVDPALTDAVGRAPSALPGGVEFILLVGRLNVRKNHSFVVATLWSACRDPRYRNLSATKVVVVGTPSGRADVDDPVIEEGVAAGHIIMIDEVDDGELRWLYEHCALFISTSFDEGFGLPLVEAAHFGARILASDIPVFRETVGAAATFVAPSDAVALAREADRLCGESSERTPVDRGVDYSWTAFVERLRAELADGPRRGRSRE